VYERGCVYVGIDDFVFSVVGWSVWDFVIFLFSMLLCVCIRNVEFVCMGGVVCGNR